MTSLQTDLVKRIDRLPKPRNTADALQPIFEATSNALHSVQERFPDGVSKNGKITVDVVTSRNKDGVSVTVQDNGSGLNTKNWDAFKTTDTDNKISIGGKGVGRLLWLDCFESIKIASVYKDGDQYMRRTFDFVLAPEDQISNERDDLASGASDTSFQVQFQGLRWNGYLAKFPGRGNFIFQHLTSHFLPTFIGQQCPHIAVHVGDETRNYPDAIADVVHRQEVNTIADSEEYGTLRLALMECDKVASADLQGKHFVHFIAHDRTVHSQKIDSKIGLEYFGNDGDKVFHAVLSGEYFDENVNQQRAAFQFEDAVIDRVINDVCLAHIETFLREPLDDLSAEQQQKIKRITDTYPSVAFGSTAELQEKVPSGELKEDAIYSHLAREQFRRDERQASKIKAALNGLKGEAVTTETFSQKLSEASAAIEDAEQRSLAEYIVRRKVVLDFIEILLQKVRDNVSDGSYQNEAVLHSFTCPMKVETASPDAGDNRKVTASPHDLWVIDERLTFAQYFSSDMPFSKLSEESDSGERPDVLIFDRVHGLSPTSELSKILLIEFKKPGREKYKDHEHPQQQIEGYIRELQSGKLTDVKGRPIQLDENTAFHCFIVADIIGQLDTLTFSWHRTTDGCGRMYMPNNGFKGSIELIGWDQLINDAKARNQAFFDKTGLSGNSLFESD